MTDTAAEPVGPAMAHAARDVLDVLYGEGSSPTTTDYLVRILHAMRYASGDDLTALANAHPAHVHAYRMSKDPGGLDVLRGMAGALARMRPR